MANAVSLNEFASIAAAILARKSNDDMQDRELGLLEQDASETPGAKILSSERLQFIRNYRRENPDAYDADKTMQVEELTLIEAATPAAPPPTGE